MTSENNSNHSEQDRTIQAGRIVEIFGLKSASGRKLNGKRAITIRSIDSGERWQVRVEKESRPDATKTVKLDNLKLLSCLPLPTGPERGMADAADMERAVQKTCELLLYVRGRGSSRFEPSDIMVVGPAGKELARMGESNFMFLNSVQMEQMAGVLALADFCRQGEEAGTESVLFGLLEGDPMYIDVLIMSMHCTGLIIEEENSADDPDLSRDFEVPPTKLTPDQDSAVYVRTMSEGPLLLLNEMTNYVFGEALWAALKRSEFYHLLIQRLLRWTAREARNTRDGRKLGKMARRVLAEMVGVTGLDNGPVSKVLSDFILEQAGKQLRGTDVATTERVQKIMNGEA